MSDHYVDSKINEALKATNGDEKDAVKLIITWAVRDQALLLGLAKPELKNLASERVHAALRSTKKGSTAPAHPKENKEAIVFAAGKGEKRQPVKVPPPKTSERQASVMHQLVAAFKKQK